MADILRAIYNFTWINLGLSNKYRYEHFIYKPDFIYEFDKLKIAINC